MTPALKQLKRECTLEQRLLVEKVESLLAEGFAKLEDKRKSQERTEKWMSFLHERMMEWCEGHGVFRGTFRYSAQERIDRWHDEFDRMQNGTHNV